MPLSRAGLWGLVSSKGSWNFTVFAVCLMPLDGLGDVRGSLKVMIFLVLGLGRVTASMLEWGTSLGTLNSSIPRWFDAVY